jgi:hypothetical protein
MAGLNAVGSGLGDKMKAPPPQDYMALANQQAANQQALLSQQTRANRPNQSNPYATRAWTEGPDGQWSSSDQFTGAMGELNASLQQQARDAMSTPFSLSGLPGLTDGAAARDQAISSAYGQATSRLDPAFAQREDAMRTRLVNQGLQPGSEAYNREMEMFGREKNDAYGGAMSSAIAQGTSAGSALFGQSMSSREQALEEMLRQRGQAMGELHGMNGMLGQSGFHGAGLGEAANLLGAGGMQDASDMGRWQQQMQMLSDALSSLMQLGGTVGSVALSDERAKTDVQRLEEEALPGVPIAVFRYRPEHGLGTALQVGVMAQDLQRVMPSAVASREDGLLMVHPAFAPLPLE